MKALLIDEIKNAVRGTLKTVLRKGLVTGVTTDSRRVNSRDMFVALRGPNYDGHDYIEQAVKAGALVVLVDRNIPLSESVQEKVCVIKVDDSLEALGKLARFYRRNLLKSVRLIGVTGSNGKTTTREMIYHVLSKHKKGHRSPKNFNNNIGVPLTILGIEPDHEFAVVEIASNAPGEIAPLSRIAEPDIAVITHIGPSHLEGLKDIEGVSVEKVSIVAGLKEHGIMICGIEHQPTLDRVRALGINVITFGLDPSAQVGASNLRHEDGHLCFETNDHFTVRLPIGGVHNVKNALAALAVTRRLGISSSQFAEAMLDFTPIPGRMCYHTVKGITVIDDSYNANPSSMEVALDELCNYEPAGRRVLVCGDMCELGEEALRYHQQLGRDVAARKIDLLFAVGSQAAETANAALAAGMGRSDVQKSITGKRLARLIKSMIRDDDVILVKGSRAMQLELVVESLKRYRGGRPKVV